MQSFTKYKNEFNSEHQSKNVVECFLPVHLTSNQKAIIRNIDGEPNEEYYKWQFLTSIVKSELFAKDFIGTEIYFPKGNKSSAPLKMDAAIFDEKDWFEHYRKWHLSKDQNELDWLRQHLIGVIEFKGTDNREIESIYNQQLKPALKESEREFCLAILYDTERLYLFRKHNNKFLRLSEEYNQKGDKSGTKSLLCIYRIRI